MPTGFVCSVVVALVAVLRVAQPQRRHRLRDCGLSRLYLVRKRRTERKMSLLSINTFGAVPSTSSAALTPEQPPKHLTSNDEIDLALIRQGYDRGAWSRSLTEEEAASNTTAGAIKRSRARLTVTSSPSGAEESITVSPAGPPSMHCSPTSPIRRPSSSSWTGR